VIGKRSEFEEGGEVKNTFVCEVHILSADEPGPECSMYIVFTCTGTQKTILVPVLLPPDLPIGAVRWLVGHNNQATVMRTTHTFGQSPWSFMIDHVQPLSITY
jgi:hypothetical protein